MKFKRVQISAIVELNEENNMYFWKGLHTGNLTVMLYINNV
jgi:hypothetical protein